MSRKGSDMEQKQKRAIEVVEYGEYTLFNVYAKGKGVWEKSFKGLASILNHISQSPDVEFISTDYLGDRVQVVSYDEIDRFIYE